MIKKILIVVGTRPNFIKITQFVKIAIQFPLLNIKVVHTGQHFDNKMADIFFEQFNLIPDYFLNIPAGSANLQMAEIMIRLERLIIDTFKPDWMLVVGDVNSTLAAALTANKLGIKLAHIESGLRSNDHSMPEEINRILTDKITDCYFVTEKSGVENLLIEGTEKQKIHFVGNTMIDTMVAFENEIEKSDVLKKYQIEKQKYVLLTMHRPATVDNKEGLQKLLSLIESITKKYKVIFPIHPRTIKNIEKFGLLERFKSNMQTIAIEPLDYFSFQKLISNCKFILTDSGGIQEESTFMKIPCLTLRPNTERPSTCNIGTNTLVPFDISLIEKEILSIEQGTYKTGNIPELWDGKATERIMTIIDSMP